MSAGHVWISHPQQRVRSSRGHRLDKGKRLTLSAHSLSSPVKREPLLSLSPVSILESH